MALLASGVRRRDAGHGRDQRLVISQECELPTFEEKTKMPDCEESCDSLSNVEYLISAGDSFFE